jgi:hypothetical protein
MLTDRNRSEIKQREVREEYTVVTSCQPYKRKVLIKYGTHLEDSERRVNETEDVT